MSAPRIHGHDYVQCEKCTTKGNPKPTKHLYIEPVNHTTGNRLLHKCVVCNPVEDDMRDE